MIWKSFYEDLKLVYQLTIIYEEIYEILSSLESPIVIDDNLKITSVSFLIADFNYLIVNLIVLRLNYYIVSFYT